MNTCIRSCSVSIVLAAVLASAAFGAQKSRKDVTPAPLPKQVLDGKKVFVLNEGAGMIYDVVYGEMKAWERYELVDSAKGADLVFAVSYGLENPRTHVWSATNTYSGSTQVYSGTVSDGIIRLTIVNPGTQEVLWAAQQYAEPARREKNRDKNLINAAKKVVENFRRRIEPPKDK